MKPAFPDWPTATFIVQPDGAVDLGFVGDVFVTGMTLAEAEQRIAEQLNTFERARDPNAAPITGYRCGSPTVRASTTMSSAR